jgi:hypothetical protein
MYDIRHNLNVRKVHMKVKTKLKRNMQEIQKEMRYGGCMSSAGGTGSKAVEEIETTTEKRWAYKLGHG